MSLAFGLAIYHPQIDFLQNLRGLRWADRWR